MYYQVPLVMSSTGKRQDNMVQYKTIFFCKQ